MRFTRQLIKCIISLGCFIFFSNYLLLFCYIHIYNIFFFSAFHSWSGFPLITLAFFPLLKVVTPHDFPHSKKKKNRKLLVLTLPEVFLSRFFIPVVSFLLTSYAFFITWITSRIALPILAPKSISHSCCWPIRCPWAEIDTEILRSKVRKTKILHKLYKVFFDMAVFWFWNENI